MTKPAMTTPQGMLADEINHELSYNMHSTPTLIALLQRSLTVLRHAPQGREALEREEKYLHDLIEDEGVGSVMHGDIEGAFHRLATALTPAVAPERRRDEP